MDIRIELIFYIQGYLLNIWVKILLKHKIIVTSRYLYIENKYKQFLLVFEF